jgi:hypothetical protein
MHGAFAIRSRPPLHPPTLQLAGTDGSGDVPPRPEKVTKLRPVIAMPSHS